MKLKNKILLIILVFIALFLLSGNNAFCYSSDEQLAINSFNSDFDKDILLVLTNNNYVYIGCFGQNPAYAVDYSSCVISYYSGNSNNKLMCDCLFEDSSFGGTRLPIEIYKYENGTLSGHNGNTFGTLVYNNISNASYCRFNVQNGSTGEVVFTPPVENQGETPPDFKTLMETTSTTAVETIIPTILEMILKIVPILVGLVALSIGFLLLLGTLRKS